MGIIAKCAFGMHIDNLDAKDNIFMQKATQTFTSPANRSPLVMFICENFFKYPVIEIY